MLSKKEKERLKKERDKVLHSLRSPSHVLPSLVHSFFLSRPRKKPRPQQRKLPPPRRLPLLQNKTLQNPLPQYNRDKNLTKRERKMRVLALRVAKRRKRRSQRRMRNLPLLPRRRWVVVSVR